jgi:hypothetical protein
MSDDNRAPADSVPIVFWFKRREGDTPDRALWWLIEGAVREVCEGTIWELVHTKAVGFERGKGLTQWP